MGRNEKTKERKKKIEHDIPQQIKVESEKSNIGVSEIKHTM